MLKPHRASSDSVASVPINVPASEETVLNYWREIDAFKTSQKLSEGKPEFSFYDGPPFATGKPHYGHLLAGTIKVSGGFRLGITKERQAWSCPTCLARRHPCESAALPAVSTVDMMEAGSGRLLSAVRIKDLSRQDVDLLKGLRRFGRQIQQRDRALEHQTRPVTQHAKSVIHSRSLTTGKDMR